MSLSALESLAVHLGGLREGRKSILFVSQGPPMLRGGARSAQARCATSSSRPIATTSPFTRWIRASSAKRASISDANAALSADTGGRRIGLTNDFSRPLQGVMADASAYYLLGYESPATAADGKFRKIDVDVRRGGVRVIARTGYWAPRPEDLRTSGGASAGPTVPPEVAEALDSLRDQSRRIAVGDWIGVRPLDSGDSQVTVVFETLAGRAAPRVGAIELEVTGPDGTRSYPTPLEESAGVWAARFVAPPGRLRTRATVQKRRRRGDRQLVAWHHRAGRSRQSQVGTPIVYRPASVAQYRALMAGTEIAPSAVRRFRRTDRTVVRLAMGAT